MLPLFLMLLAAAAVACMAALLAASAWGGWELLSTALTNAAGEWSLHPAWRSVSQGYMLLQPLVNSLWLAVAVPGTIVPARAAAVAVRATTPARVKEPSCMEGLS